jgi:hypothetical protein
LFLVGLTVLISNFFRELILDRIYDGEYTGKDGETYYESYRWEYDVAPEDRDENIVDIQIIVDRYENGDYKS